MKGRRRELFSRIYRRCIKVRGPLSTPCWIWQGSDTGDGRGGGYGKISLDGWMVVVHRVMYQVWYGPIAPRKQVDHRCRNRRCCNPLHLEHVTHLQNQRRKT